MELYIEILIMVCLFILMLILQRHTWLIFLTDGEVKKLMEKSLKDGVNYLYEKVKDYEYFPYSLPDCLY